MYFLKMYTKLNRLNEVVLHANEIAVCSNERKVRRYENVFHHNEKNLT